MGFSSVELTCVPGNYSLNLRLVIEDLLVSVFQRIDVMMAILDKDKGVSLLILLSLSEKTQELRDAQAADNMLA